MNRSPKLDQMNPCFFRDVSNDPYWFLCAVKREKVPFKYCVGCRRSVDPKIIRNGKYCEADMNEVLINYTRA